VIESTHAHEHWLRMAASDAIRDIVTTPPNTNLPVTGLLLLNVKSRADDANRAVVDGDYGVALHQSEAALRQILRAVVILRREVLK